MLSGLIVKYATPMLSSRQKDCRNFSRKILLPIHKSTIFREFEYTFAYLSKVARNVSARETISSTFFKQNLCSDIISSKSEYKIALEAYSRDTFRSRDERDLRSE